MEIEHVEEIKFHIVKMISGIPRIYIRYSAKDWKICMEESEETIRQPEQLEEVFQEWKKEEAR